ncbi:MAG: hypothetical protein [Sanya fiers-like virus 16]|nr:MAG: hypothetical protein [Sanya fiers-like virus 16]
MPSMADITVKKSDGTTNVTYNAVVPSAGDAVWAEWVDLTTVNVPAYRAKLRVRSRYNGPRTARRIEYEFTYPVSITIDSQNSLVGTVAGSGSVVLPQKLIGADLKEASHQMTNLLASALMKSILETGYAPT